jgi:hypothetical protein
VSTSKLKTSARLGAVHSVAAQPTEALHQRTRWTPAVGMSELSKPLSASDLATHSQAPAHPRGCRVAGAWLHGDPSSTVALLPSALVAPGLHPGTESTETTEGKPPWPAWHSPLTIRRPRQVSVAGSAYDWGRGAYQWCPQALCELSAWATTKSHRSTFASIP